MNEQEKINVELQRQIDMQNARIDKIDVKLDAFIQEIAKIFYFTYYNRYFLKLSPR